MGLLDKITGRGKKAAGDLTGDASLRREGRQEERKGEAKDELASAQDKADAKAVARSARARPRTSSPTRTKGPTQRLKRSPTSSARPSSGRDGVTAPATGAAPARRPR